MNNRIQLTEEYAREILDECACTETCDFKLDETISVMKQRGYIIKSDLQQKVEEAEEAISEIYPALKKWAEINNDKPNFCIRNSSVLEIIEGYIFLKKQLEEKDK